MTKRKDSPVQQAELPMKDVTPKADPKPSAKKAEAAKSKLPKPRAAAKKAGTAVAVHKPGNQVAAAKTVEPKSFLQVIIEAAADPRCDVAKMQALLNMQKEIVAEERKQTFDTAFIALQAELPVINKDGKIEVRKKDSSGERTGALQQATPYATFEEIMDVVQPLLTKHGFGLSFQTKANNVERLLVIGHLIGHGHERETEFPLPAETSGSKNNVQGWGSSLSYGKRYCTIALLNIRSRALQDRDTNGFPGDFKVAKGGGLAEAAPEPQKVTAAQVGEIRVYLEDARVSDVNFCTHYGIAKVEDLPSNLFAAAKKALAEHKAKHRG